MRIIELSDHPGEKLRAALQQRQRAAEQALAAYEQELARHRASAAAARTTRDEAWARRHALAWLRGVFAVWAEQGRTPSRPVFYRGTTDQEAILTAGMRGEPLVADELGRALSDDWVLVRGYKNSGGEIDHLLLGPSGLFAMEVKHRNATVYIDGDEWRSEKYDRFDNLVEEGRTADRGGRSPSRQVNDSADALQRFLNTRCRQQVVIQRIVLLTHPRPELGSYSNFTVSVATSVDTVLGWVRQSAPTLQPAQLTELQRLIERDHRYHQSHNGRSAIPGGRDGAYPSGLRRLGLLCYPHKRRISTIEPPYRENMLLVRSWRSPKTVIFLTRPAERGNTHDMYTVQSQNSRCPQYMPKLRSPGRDGSRSARKPLGPRTGL